MLKMLRRKCDVVEKLCWSACHRRIMLSQWATMTNLGSFLHFWFWFCAQIALAGWTGNNKYGSCSYGDVSQNTALSIITPKPANRIPAFIRTGMFFGRKPIIGLLVSFVYIEVACLRLLDVSSTCTFYNPCPCWKIDVSPTLKSMHRIMLSRVQNYH